MADGVFSDPGFVGAIIGAVSGLVGAIIGGLATYYASIRQYRIEHEIITKSALIASMLEIMRNQTILVLSLDRVMPCWLNRKTVGQDWQIGLLSLTGSLSPYQNRVYDSFFNSLISSKYGAELKSYYGFIDSLNSIIKANPSGVPASDSYPYVRSLAFAIEIADDLVKEIQQFCADMNQRWGRDKDLEEFLHYSDRSLFIAGLYWTNVEELEKFVAEGKITKGLKPNVLKGGIDQIRHWLEMAKK